ncbi:hypothetical protein NDU88_000344 [Pleurodeles waltl]|uniref:Uncharacterized protein n=1 Tax=Pleurodeles waltl TaxID=8319 RepID=A0AAV7TEP1_PLEWA|nr:hypothetical protein NDU88_000344 [Pleurodeles waltl]
MSSRKEETRGRPDDVSGTDDSAETSRTLGTHSEESEVQEAPSDNSGHAYGKAWPPQVHQADPSRKTGTITAAPDQEDVMTASNPLPLPGNGGQGQEMRAFRVQIKDIPKRTGGVEVSSRKEEMRGRPDDVFGTDDSAETSRTLGTLPEESEAREAPIDNSGHAYGKAGHLRFGPTKVGLL